MATSLKCLKPEFHYHPLNNTLLVKEGKLAYNTCEKMPACGPLENVDSFYYCDVKVPTGEFPVLPDKRRVELSR